MNVPFGINIVTAAIILIFAIPVLIGIIRPLTGERIHRSFASLLSSLCLLASILLSVYLTRIILSDSQNIVLVTLYQLLPALNNTSANAQVWTSVLLIVVLALLIDGILWLLTLPVRRYALPPLSRRVSAAVNAMGGFFRRIIGGLWQLPTSVWLVLVVSLLLNFYTGLFNSPLITASANTSAPYQFVQENVIQPLMSSSAVKDIQVILKDSFRFAEGAVTNDNGQIQLIKYFNGVPLNEAIRSSDDIDAKAKDIVGTETDDRQKAYLLYLWICDNLSYDNDKVAKLSNGSADIPSGAVVAYKTRTGVCFDYACLYIAMCRAVDVKVRFLTGLGFTGTAWGDHAWNQVYANGWINVDPTFGSSGINYFDRAHFGLDHRDAVVQGEW